MIRSQDRYGRPPTRLAFHASRIVIDVGVLIVLGSMSLPFVSAQGFRQQAVAADALPALLLLLPIFVITLLPDQAAPVAAPLGWASLALAVAALPYTVVKYLDASTLAGTLEGSVGMGARILVFGSFVTLVGIAIGLARVLMRLPVAGTYPARQAGSPEAPRREPRPAPAATPRAARVPPSEPGRAVPAAAPDPRRSARRDPAPGADVASRGRHPTGTTSAPQAASPPAARSRPRPGASGPQPTSPPARPPTPPQPQDPDTEPTLPAQRPVRPWCPDDLDDLFS